VTAIQHGKPIFTLSASFQRAEPGLEHALPMPAAPPPESLRPNSERYAEAIGVMLPAHVRESPIDVRSVGPMSVEVAVNPSLRPSAANLVWLRVNGELPDDPLLHVCLMTYASDLTLLDTVLLDLGVSWHNGTAMGASLDHAMWFHRPFRADQWLLYAQESTSASGARGLARGEVFTADGDLVVSVVQEGLIRTTPKSNY
jgi:acyl-CoA thioesterase-2